MKKLLFFFILCLSASVVHAQTATKKSYAYQNGNWYNGTDFTKGTWYVVNGLFTQKAPAQIGQGLFLKTKIYCFSTAVANAAVMTIITSLPT